MRIVPVDRTALVPLTPATRNSLQLEDVGENTCVLSSTLKDGSVGWIAKGSSLEVFNMKSAERISAWCFGAVLKDPHTVVTAISEVCYENTSCLAVATSSSTTETGLVCVLDLHHSKVIKAVEIPYKVTALETISGVGNQMAVNAVLSETLRCFCGVLAVGTQNGHVYILDLCLDDDTESDEVSPVSVVIIGPKTNDITAKRYQAINNGNHLCLELDENSHSRGYFYFKKPDSSVIKTFVADDVFISSLHFVKQIGSLAVGFNFGCFQLWDVSQIHLEFCSRTEDDLAAVTHFAYQEPENDPRNYVYLWVSQGPLPTESMDGMTSCIKMYQACYESRHWFSGIGTVFQGLSAIACVFDHFLTKDPYMGWEDDALGSRLVSCYTLSDPKYKHAKSRDEEDSFDESSAGPDLSLCVFAWEALMGDSNAPSVTHLGLFDLNRWYHAQMPGSVRMHGGTNRDVCPFFAFLSTSEVDEAIESANLLAVHVDYQSLRRFVSPQIPPPDSFFYPSSMAMDANFLSENGIVQNKYLGVQMQVVANMEKQGPAVLLEPNDLFNICLYSNLLPKNVQTGLASTSPAGKREALLSVALDYNLVGYIIRCVREWASGDFNHLGCNLRSILDWAWKKLAAIKESVDKLCVVLYDWSGVQLDSQSLQLLHHHRTSLQHLNCVLQALLTCPASVTQQGQQDLEIKFNVSSLITQHLSTVLWFQAVGLLPEFPEDEDSMDGQYGYPVKMLREMFRRRRQEITKLHQNVDGTDLLIIDGIISTYGSAIRDVWEHGLDSGLYPPPSVNALLNMFLVESVPLLTKRLIVMYLLFDLMHLSPEDQTEKFSARLQAFAQAFSIPRSWSRVIQGFWLLDHKEFEECLIFLLDPMVRVELEPWQNTRIIKSFLFHGRHKLALKFIQTRQPPLATPEDVKLKLSVFLANGLVAQAHEFQQIHRDRSSSDDLLHHLFLGCQQTKRMDKLLQLPLNDEEERHLVEYLQTSQEPHSGELLVMYYLQRSRYIEAIRANAKLKHSIMGDTDIRARERAHARNSIVDRYFNILPKVQRKLAFDSHPQKKQTAYARIEAVKPVPLSAVVNRGKKMHPISQATLIQAVMEKVNQVRGQPEQVIGQDEVIGHDEVRSQGRAETKATDNEEMDTEVGMPVTKSQGLGPFIGTPSTPRQTSRVTGSHTDVHFAITKKTEEGALSQLAAMANPLGLSPSSYSLTLSPVRNSPLHSSFHNKSRRMSRFCSAEILSLLKTPPVKRKHPSQCNTPAVATPATPHSILKVRHASRLNTPEVATSPLVERVKLQAGITPSQVLVERALGSAIKEPVLSLSQSESPSSTSQVTPKLLRFNVPQSPDTSTDIKDDSEMDDSQEIDELVTSEFVDKEEKEEEEEEEMEEEIEDEEQEQSPASTPRDVSPSSTPSPSKSATATKFTFAEPDVVTHSKLHLPRTPVSQRKPHSHSPSSTNSTPCSVHSCESEDHFHPEHRPSLKSVRDRSPTPERHSPKTSPHRRRSGSYSDSHEIRATKSDTSVLSRSALETRGRSRRDRSPVFQISQGLDEETESDSGAVESETNDKLVAEKSSSTDVICSRASISATRSTVTTRESSRTVARTVIESESGETESETRTTESEAGGNESLPTQSESRLRESESTATESESRLIKSESISKAPVVEPQVFELSDSEESEAENTMETSDVDTQEQLDEKDGDEAAEQDYVMNIDESDEEVEAKEEIVTEEVTEAAERKNEEQEEIEEQEEKEEEEKQAEEMKGEEITVEEKTIEDKKAEVEKELAVTTSAEEMEVQPEDTESESSKVAESESRTTLHQISESSETAEKESENKQGESEKAAQVPLTPTRRSTRKISSHPEEAFKTPAQSGSVAVMMPTPPESAQGTPTKEKRLSSPETVVQESAEPVEVMTPRRGRRTKKAEEESPPKPKGDGDKKDPETPSRRGRPKKKVDASPEKQEKDSAEEPQVVTPSRRGRAKKVEQSPEKTEKEVSASPSRRGKTRKADTSPTKTSEKDTAVPVSPSRRGRTRKTDSSPEKSLEREVVATTSSPSRRGRPRRADTSPGKALEKDTAVPVSPSRRGRTRKTDSSPEKSLERETIPTSPSRRGRTRKADHSPEKVDVKETVATSPSRKGRSRKTDHSPEKVEEKEQTASSPSRRGRPSVTKVATPVKGVKTPQKRVTPSRSIRGKKAIDQKETETTESELTSQTESETISESETDIPTESAKEGETASSEAETLVDMEIDNNNKVTMATTPTRTSRRGKTDSKEPEEIVVTPSRRGRPRKDPEEKDESKTEHPTTPARSTRRTTPTRSLKSNTDDVQEPVTASPGRSSRRLRNASESSTVSEISNASPPKIMRRQKKLSESSDISEARQSPSRSSQRLKKISESSEVSGAAGTSPSRSSRRLRKISESSNASDVSTVSNSSVGRRRRSQRSRKESEMSQRSKKESESESTVTRMTRRSAGRTNQADEENITGPSDAIMTRSRTASESSSVVPEASPTNSPVTTPSTSPVRAADVTKKSGSKVKRVPSKRSTRSSISSQGQDDDKGDSGPLSSTSFMMTVRTTGLTEEASQTAEDEDAAIDAEVESLSFRFSHPAAIASKPELMDVSDSPTPHMFVFSPPITRVRSPARRASLAGNLTPISAPSTPRLLPQSKTDDTPAPPAPATRLKATKVTTQKEDSPGDVRLLTPPDPSEEKPRVGKRVTRSQSLKESGIAKRYSKKPKRGLKLWQ